ncbi:Unconventional myosin-IXb [Takifugu flavidus]|uniref:Unconventional myosin-IXb n=1 Tax=Takifugu flavidus TaxID=433684 RepID=A0A5C6P420_9TELE|nr:Unconventional myosin-IXb [Takifugu flavidus]
MILASLYSRWVRVSASSSCVEILITEQFRRYKEKMQNIQELEYAEALAVHQLKLRRQNTIVEKPSELDIPQKIDSDETERTLIERIRSIKQEKEDLTCRLPELEQENSDNEILDSASSMSSESLEDRLGSVDSEGRPSPTDKPLNGSFDDLDIPYIDEEEEDEDSITA